MYGTNVSRRRLLRGAGAVTAASLLARFPGARLIKAQGDAEYDAIALVQQTGTMQGGALPNWPDAGVVGLSEDGLTCGWVAASADRTSPAVWSPTGKLKKLESGKFGGSAQAANSRGLVVGSEFGETEGFDNRRAAAWLDGERIDLHSLLPQDVGFSIARGVNDLNQILVQGKTSGYILSVESAEEISVSEIERSLYLGSDGQIVTNPANSTAEVVSFKAGFPDDLRTIELEMPEEGFIINVKAINAAGTILVAVGDKEFAPIATIVIEGDEQTVINPPSEGHRLACWSMNDDGMLAGELWNENQEKSAVVVVDGEIIELNERVPADVGVRLTQAAYINNAGMILALGEVDEMAHYFLLIPR